MSGPTIRRGGVGSTSSGTFVLDAEFVLRWVVEAAARIDEQRDFLTQLDAAIGDADHGVNMQRGFTAAVATVQSSSDRSPGSLLEEVGKTLIYRVGGAAGPLYGTGFRQIGVTISEAVTPDGEVLLSALRAGLEGIQALGAAAAGDKTMVDAWEPAVAAFQRTLQAGGVTEEAARNAAEAANAGVEATLPLQARKGRASYLGSRSIGHQDPGATSTAIIFGGARTSPPSPTVTALFAAGDRRGTIQSVDRAARILRVLGSSPRLGVTEISDQLGIAKATVHGLLRTLEQQELVEQDADNGKYRLGAAMLQLGNSFLDNHELRARSLMWAGSLATRVGEAVRVGVMNGETVLIVHHVFRPDNSVQILEVGASIPWHACALGKAVVAFDPPSRRNALLGANLSPLTGRTQTEPSVLRTELEDVATLGVAVEDQEAVVGEAEIASPVFDHRGDPAGAISVVGPVERLLPDGPSPELIAAVREAGRGLSRDMGAGRFAARG